MDEIHNIGIFVGSCAIGAGVSFLTDSYGWGWTVFGICIILQVIANMIFKIEDV